MKQAYLFKMDILSQFKPFDNVVFLKVVTRSIYSRFVYLSFNLIVFGVCCVFRMLVSQGLTLNKLVVQSLDDSVFEKDPRKIWKKLFENHFLFRRTQAAIWLDY